MKNFRVNEDGSISTEGTLIFNKSGTNGEMCRLTLPADYVRALKLSKENKNVEICLKDGKIIIIPNKNED
jgi:hypothetical protein